ncbi:MULTISPECIES: hypothetical protein [Vibrio]|uniref:hypothetical protein n=1 Tax=Vibrio TaxID=662 RepID=UPI002A188373|nr:hypothetical protein [Vibrio metoecus]
MMTTNTDPPTTIRTDTVSTNIMRLPPSTIAMTTNAMPPIRPTSVAKSTKNSSGYTFAIMKSLPSLSATE